MPMAALGYKNASLMIFRLSEQLMKKIKVAPTTCLPLDPDPFIDWSAHLFTADRAQYVIVTNTASLYSVLTFGRRIADNSEFIGAALTAMREYMTSDGTEFIYRRFVAPASGVVRFSKALNRSVTGSMNDLIYHAKFYLTEREASPFDAASALNEMPMSALNYGNPREAFKGLTVEQPISGDEL